MKAGLHQTLLILLLAPLLTACDPKERDPTDIVPDDFVGVWVLIPVDVEHKSKTRTLLLHKSNAEKPATPTGTFMDGDVDKRMNIKGTATDDTFVGTYAIPRMVSWSGTVMLTIHQRGSATVTIDNAVYNGLKRTQ